MPPLDVEGGLKHIELVVFVDDFLGQSVGIFRFAFEREDCLSLDVAYLCYGAGGRVALGYENRRLQLFVGIAFRVVQMYAAVEEFLVVDTDLFSLFAGEFCYAGHRLALALAFLNFFEDNIGDVEVLMEIVVELFFDEITDEFGYRRASRCHFARTELDLRL